VVLKVTGKDSLEAMAANGLTDSVTVTLSRNSTLFEVEAVGASPEQATATVQEVIKLIGAEIASSQRQYRVLPEDTITTSVVADGSSIEVVTTKKKRVLIVAAGVGLLLTAAATIALDALLRRRQRRRFGSAVVDREPSGPGIPAAWRPHVTPTAPPPAPSQRTPTGAVMPVLSLPAGTSTERPSVTYEIAEAAPAVPPRPMEDWRPADDKRVAEDRRRPSQYVRPHTNDGVGPDDLDEESAGDTTIVLPLAYLSKRDDRNSKH